MAGFQLGAFETTGFYVLDRRLKVRGGRVASSKRGADTSESRRPTDTTGNKR